MADMPEMCLLFNIASVRLRPIRSVNSLHLSQQNTQPAQIDGIVYLLMG